MIRHSGSTHHEQLSLIQYFSLVIIEDPKGQNYIPLAPLWTSAAGLTYTNKTGLNGSLRYRFVGNRAANKSYSQTAAGYFITDAVINYTKPKYEIGLAVNNLFNRKWKETQFDTKTRLNGAATGGRNLFYTGNLLCRKTQSGY